jgi:hypothetical protein
VRKPNQLIESFNSRLRDECLNEHLFYDLENAIEKINSWHDRYNNYNPLKIGLEERNLFRSIDLLLLRKNLKVLGKNLKSS